MSKHKHFHQIKNPRQMLQHGHREGIGPMRLPAPKSQAPANLKKETAHSAVNAEDGKAEME